MVVDKKKLKKHMDKNSEEMEKRLENITVNIELKGAEIATIFGGCSLILMFGGRGKPEADAVIRKLTDKLKEIDPSLI